MGGARKIGSNVSEEVKNAMGKKAKTKSRPPASVEAKWRTIEKVVALLEKALCPEARVRHDVELPNLATGNPEQCDVVIELGNEPRVFRTIVEVQKRNSRVKPNCFRGWCQKMREVGAHRLICVSAMPFPKSVKDAVAKQYGPTVLLVRLEDLETNQWPIALASSMRVWMPIATFDPSVKPYFIFAPGTNPFTENGFNVNTKDRIIKRGGNPKLVPVSELISEGLSKLNEQPPFVRLPAGNHRFTLLFKPKDASLCRNGLEVPIDSMRVTYAVEVRAAFFPFEFSSYTQDGHKDSLAWIARAAGKLDGDDVEIRFVLTAASNGSFKVSCPQVLGGKESGYLLWGYAKSQPK